MTTHKTQLSDDWTIPTGLTRQARAAAKVIRDFAAEQGLTAAGGRVFYTPAEWRQRGEDYCRDAELVIVYDGADISAAISMDRAMDYRSYAALDQLAERLAARGLHLEEGTVWYAGLYAA